MYITLVNFIKQDIMLNIDINYTLYNASCIFNNVSYYEICQCYSQIELDILYIKTNYKQIDNINLQSINNYIHKEIVDYCFNYLFEEGEYTVDEILELAADYY